MASERGFTLVEALVAVLIAGMAFVAMHQALTGSWRGITANEHEQLALSIAKRELAEAGIAGPLVSGERAGSAQNGISWRVSIEARDRRTDGDEVGRLQAFDVVVEVAWRDWRGPRRLILRTIKLQV